MVKQHYGSKAKPLFTDTDSLCHLIQTQNVFEDQKTRAELFDLSNYPEGPYKDSTNKRTLVPTSVLLSEVYHSLEPTYILVITS